MEEFNQMAQSLGPNTGDLLWNIALYIIFGINLLMLFMLPDGSTLQTFLSILVLIAAVLDKTYGFGHILDPSPYTPEYYHEQVFIGTYLIRVIMFVAPLTIAGSTREGSVRAVAIVAALVGVGYAFYRWFRDQRDNPTTDIGYLDLEIMAQSVVMLATLGGSALRRRWYSATVAIDRDVPVAVAVEFAAHDIEV